MGKLLILADDLTGALDAGVQLSNKGYRVEVCTSCDADLKNKDNEVLVINTSSRHLPYKEAGNIIRKLVNDASNYYFIYKKTDSGLRGNVGSELSALLDACHEQCLHFVPAYPKLNRITKKGVHYVDGKPLNQSIFANDIINPVKCSRVDEIIHSQSDISTNGEGIIIHDCVSDTEMAELAKDIFNEKNHIAAGCAGLLEYYPKSNNKIEDKQLKLNKKMVVISGTMNEVSFRQLDEAVKNGSICYHLPMDLIASDQWRDCDIDEYLRNINGEIGDYESVIFDTRNHFPIKENMDPIVLSKKIAHTMGLFAYKFVLNHSGYTVMIIGGDTLEGFIKEAHIKAISPVEEIVPGVVLAKYDYQHKEHYLITKSGAFGSNNLIGVVLNYLKKGEM